MGRGNVDELLKVVGVESFLKSEIISQKDLFVSANDRSINVYYWGENILELSKSRRGKAKIRIHKKYVENTALQNNNKIKDSYLITDFTPGFVKNFKSSFQKLKQNIEFISHGEKSEKLEKKYQGVIACNNNKNEQSDWYCVDIEYCSKGMPFGRLDMVAISKVKNDNGKYRVVLIELKYSNAAYASGHRKYLYNDKNDKGYYIEAALLKTNMYKGNQYQRRFGCKYDENTGEITNYSFGSGIIGHFYNYSKCIFENNGQHYESLKKELFDILCVKERLDCFVGNNQNSDNIGEELLKLLKLGKDEFVSNLVVQPECVFLTVGGDVDKCKGTMNSYLTGGKKNTPDILRCSGAEWSLKHNNGTGVIKTIKPVVKIDGCFPKEFDQLVRYLFTDEISPETLNIIDNATDQQELKMNIWNS